MSCRTGAHALRSAGEQRPRLSAGKRCPAEAGRLVATSPDVALAAPHGGTRNDKAPHLARPQKVVRVFPRCPPKGNQPLAPCCTSLGCSPSRRTTVGRSWSHGLPVFFNDHSTAGWECPGSPEGRPGCGRKRHQQKSPTQWPGFLWGAASHNGENVRECSTWRQAINPRLKPLIEAIVPRHSTP